MAKWVTKGFAFLCLALCLSVANANEAAPAVADPVLEARMLAIAAELRCLVCQNQTIADSHAELAIDLRQQVREMLQKGMTEKQITDYMTDRYGDFVLYRPPFNRMTALLWIGPGVLLVGGLLGLGLVLRRRSRMPEDRFDAEEPDDGPQNPQVPPAA
ncbi:MAG: cytochrome c-type biogenesis protein CcmH [Rhodoferax sp.]|nr:cytochrome c-type biogenesis protein CcmH [Rhodoferax sp.]